MTNKKLVYKFLICGYYGAGNLGDDLILEFVIGKLEKKYGSETQFFVTAINPDLINKQYPSARGIYHNDFYTIGDLISRISAVIIGGGGLIFEIPELFGEVRPENNFILPDGGPSLYANYIYLANLYHKPVMFWSVGVGNLATKKAESLIKYMVNSLDYVSVRDKNSQNVLKSLVPGKEINLSYDPVLAVEVKKPHILENKIAVSLRFWGADNFKFQKEVAKGLSKLALQKKMEVVFVPFQIQAEIDLTNDYKVCEAVGKLLSKGVKWSITKDNPLEVLSESKLVVAMRLHGVIGALASGNLPLALSYDPKINNIMSDLGFSKYVLNLNKISAENLFELGKEILEKREDWFGKLQIRIKPIIQSTQKPLEGLDFLKIKTEAIEDQANIRSYRLDIDKNTSLKLREANKKFEELFDEYHLIRTKKTEMKIQNKNLESENKILKEELEAIKASETWRIGIAIATAIKHPGQIPAITIKLARAALKRLIPLAFRENVKRLKKNLNEIITSRLYSKDLKNILEENKDAKGVVIFPPTVDWKIPLFQRPHQLALSFSKKGYLFIYCTVNFKEDNIHGFEKVAERVYVTDQLNLLRKIKNPILFISWAINEMFAYKYKCGRLIYDYIDELDVFYLYGPEMIKQHDRLIKKASLVTATADKLFQEVEKKKSKEKILLSPNAVDYEHFHREKYEMPNDLREIVGQGKPIIGYYGALAQWFDYDLLKKSAEHRDYNFVIIGPDYDGSMHAHGLDQISNIHLLGSKDYKDLPNYSHYFDVATIPFSLNKITESTSPVKLFEYMAAGCPIVTTDMHECRKYKSVLIAKNEDDYLKKLDEAVKLKNDKKYLDQMKKDALGNTWDARVDQIIEKLGLCEKAHS